MLCHSCPIWYCFIFSSWTQASLPDTKKLPFERQESMQQVRRSYYQTEQVTIIHQESAEQFELSGCSYLLSYFNSLERSAAEQNKAWDISLKFFTCFCIESLHCVSTFHSFNLAHKFSPSLHCKRSSFLKNKTKQNQGKQKTKQIKQQTCFRGLKRFYSKASLVLKKYHLSKLVFPAGRH